MSIEGEANPRY